MIERANLAAKPVAIATHTLESMLMNPRPSRTEASNITNAILDGVDSVMLSGETAAGDYPINAVDVMSKICVEAERMIGYKKLF